MVERQSIGGDVIHIKDLDKDETKLSLQFHLFKCSGAVNE